MKKYLFFAAAAIAALVSCNKEIATEEVLAPKQGYKEITLTAEVGTDTKASLDGKKVIWEKGEQVAVFTTASTSPETFSVKEVEGTTVTITGAVPASATSFIAAYPYKNAVSCTDGVVKMIVKEVDLDSLCRDEYLAFLETLIHYYYVQFDESYILEKVGEDKE